MDAQRITVQCTRIAYTQHVRITLALTIAGQCVLRKLWYSISAYKVNPKTWLYIFGSFDKELVEELVVDSINNGLFIGSGPHANLWSTWAHPDNCTEVHRRCPWKNSYVSLSIGLLLFCYIHSIICVWYSTSFIISSHKQSSVHKSKRYFPTCLTLVELSTLRSLKLPSTYKLFLLNHKYLIRILDNFVFAN